MAISLSGTSQYYIASSTPITAGPITISCWCSGATATLLFAVTVADASDTENIFALMRNGTTSIVYREVNTTVPTTGQSVSSAGLANDTWGHACGTGETTSARTTYLDGGNSGTNTTTVTPAGIDQIGLGCQANTGAATSEWNGDLFWAAIWSTGLSAAQVADLGNGYSPLTVQRQSLVFFARCEFPDPVDMIGFRPLAATGTPTQAVSPPSVMRVAPRGRGRSRLRISA